VAYRRASLKFQIPNFIGIGKTFCGWMDVRMDGRTSETHIIRSTLWSRPKNNRDPGKCQKMPRLIIFKKLEKN